MTGIFFLCFLQLDIYRKHFEALKVMGKCKKHSFCFQSARNLPSNLSRSPRGQNRTSYRNVTLHCITQCNMAKIHNVTPRITSSAINYVPVYGTNLKANCAYFESKKKNAFYIFPALLKVRNIFCGYSTTRNKSKNFRVIYTLNYSEISYS